MRPIAGKYLIIGRRGIPASNFPTLINCTCVYKISRDKRHQYQNDQSYEKFKRAPLAYLSE